MNPQDVGSTVTPSPDSTEPLDGTQPSAPISPTNDSQEVAPQADAESPARNNKPTPGYKKLVRRTRPTVEKAMYQGMRDAEVLDRKGGPKPIPKPSKEVLKAMKKLGITGEKLSPEKLMALQEFGRFLDVKITARVLMVRTFDSLEQCEMAMKVAREIAENPDQDRYTVQDRLVAVNMIANAAKSYTEMAAQIMRIAEKSGDKSDNAPTRNAPPTNAFQINVGAGQPQPVTVTSNANNGQEPEASEEED